MKPYEQTPEVANIQYAKQDLTDGSVQLNINGHVNHQYYETTITVSPDVFSDADQFSTLLKTSLLAAQQKTQKLREE